MRFFRTIDYRLPTALLLAGLLAVTGCDDPLGPDGQIEVDRGPDNFLLQVRNVEDGTQTLTYPWDNTGTQATVSIMDAISSGSAILTIEDAAGTVVHQDDIANDNDTDTAVGVAGRWRIEVQIQNVTGTFTVTISKKS